jgi:large subunit ribosomal protein L22e/Meckel syndrome type 1 protein
MKTLFIAAPLALAFGLIPHAASAAARNYDCSKPANANKAVCKDVLKTAQVAAKTTAQEARKPSPGGAKAAATMVCSTTTTQTKTERSYDCSKPGNKNKPVCKAAATPAKPVVKQTTVATTTRHYDCANAGNANKAECKAATSTQQASTRPVAVPKAQPTPARPVAAPKAQPSPPRPVAVTKAQPSTARPVPPAKARPASKSAPAASADDHNPVGAIAMCKDGAYSHAKEHVGACSRHGGVAKWLR